MNYFTLISGVFALSLVIGCAAYRPDGRSTTATRKSIKLELGQDWNSMDGLPISGTAKNNRVELCLGPEEIEQLEIGDGIGIFFLRSDTLSFNYTSQNTKIVGQFLISPVPGVKYLTLFDPFTFDAISTPIVYYEAFRVGKWIKYQDGLEQSRVFVITIMPKREPCE